MAYIAGGYTVEQFFDANGDPLVDGTIEFYLTGTSTPTAVYSDSAGTSLGTSVTLNSIGAPKSSGGTAVQLFFDDAITYKIVRKDSAGTQIDPVIDPFTIVPNSGTDADKDYASVAALTASSGNTAYNRLYIQSYYAITYPSTSGPKGGHYVHRTGGTNSSPTVGSDPGVSAIGTGAQAGYYWDADGVEWEYTDNNEVNAFCLGLYGDNSNDDAAKLPSLMARGAGKKIVFPPATYLISTAPTSNVYATIDTDNTCICAKGAVFNITYDFVTNTTSGALFEIDGASNIEIDYINATATHTVSQYTYGYIPLRIKNGSSNIDVGTIYAKNSAEGFNVNDTQANYDASGFDASTRSHTIHIDNLYVTNTLATNLADGTAGYGAALQFSGDHVTIDNMRCINVHRPIIAYGMHDLKVNLWVTDGDAALALAGYGSVKNVDLNYRYDGTDTDVSSADIFKATPNEVGNVNGSSRDLNAARTHYVQNIKVKFDVDVTSRRILAVIGKEDSVAGGADGDIVLSNIKISGKESGLTTNAVKIGTGYDTTPTAWSNTTFENIVVEDFICSASCNVVTHSGYVNSPVFRNVRAGHIYSEYYSSNIDYPVIYDNVKCANGVQTNKRDMYIYAINSHINKDNSSSIYLAPYNKVLVNTRIGNSEPITKSRYDIYSFVSNSQSLYNPSAVTDYLVGGLYLDNGSDANPLNLDIAAPAAAADLTTTTTRYSIDHRSFEATNLYAAKNTKRFVLYVKNNAGTASAVFTGLFTVEGSATTDFSAATIGASVTCTNITGSAYVAGDLTISATDADTLRFAVGVSTRYTSVEIFDS